MMTQTKNLRRLIYMMQTYDHALHQGIYSAIALASGVGLSLVSHLIGYAFGAVGLYFLLGSLINMIAYRCHKKAILRPEECSRKTENLQVGAGEVVKDIDLGDGNGVVPLIYPGNLSETHQGSWEKIKKSIVEDHDGFSRKFAEFLSDNTRKYPKYAAFISRLKIKEIRIFRAKGKSQCVAFIYFQGDLGEVWSARYTGDSFSEMIWM